MSIKLWSKKVNDVELFLQALRAKASSAYFTKNHRNQQILFHQTRIVASAVALAVILTFIPNLMYPMTLSSSWKILITVYNDIPSSQLPWYWQSHSKQCSVRRRTWYGLELSGDCSVEWFEVPVVDWSVLTCQTCSSLLYYLQHRQLN